MNEDTIVTLIGVRMAKPDVEFIFKGKSRDCNGCNLKSTCMNLDEGGHYKIVGIRFKYELFSAIRFFVTVIVPLLFIAAIIETFITSTILYILTS